MATFTYKGPPDEQDDDAPMTHGGSGEWKKGEPREIEDPAIIEQLRGHPHFEEAGGPSAQQQYDDDTPTPSQEETAAEERRRVMDELEQLGVDYDRRMGIDRLRALRDKHKTTPET